MKTTLMKTYLLTGKPSDLNGARRDSRYFARKGRRAVVVTDQRVPPYLVKHTFSGDESVAVAPDWLKRTVVDDLHAEYLAKAPVQPSRQRAAVDKLRAAQKALEDAEKAVEKGKERLRQAEATIVRTHGRNPVIDGVQYSVGHREDRVWLIRVVSKAEAIEAQRAAMERKGKKKAEKIG